MNSSKVGHASAEGQVGSSIQEKSLEKGALVCSIGQNALSLGSVSLSSSFLKEEISVEGLYCSLSMQISQLDLSQESPEYLLEHYHQARNKLLEELIYQVPEDKESLERLFFSNESEDFLDILLWKAEKARREGSSQKQTALKGSYRKFFLLSKFVGLMEKRAYFCSEDLLRRLEEECQSKSFEKDLSKSSIDPQTVTEGQLEKVIKRVLPHNSSQEEKEEYRQVLRAIVNECSQKNPFGEINRFFFPLGSALKILEKTVKLPFALGIQVRGNGVYIAGHSDQAEQLDRSNSLLENQGFQIFIPRGIEEGIEIPIQRVRFCYEKNVENFAAEASAFQRLLRSPIGEKENFESPPVGYHYGLPIVFTKSQGVDNLQKELEEESPRISVTHLFEICESVALQLSDLKEEGMVFVPQEIPSIYFRQKAEGIEGFLDEMKYVKSPSVGEHFNPNSKSALDKEGVVCLEASLYHFIHLIAHVCSLPKDEFKGVPEKESFQKSWENSLISSLGKQLSKERYQEVLSLYEESCSTDKKFASALFDYTVKKGEELESDEYAILMACAHKVAAVPRLSDLCIRALAANDAYEQGLSSFKKQISEEDTFPFLTECETKMPSLEDIQHTLSQIKQDFKNIGAAQAQPSCPTEKQTKQMIDAMLIKKFSEEQRMSIAKQFHESLEKSLKSPHWNHQKEMRLHKNEEGLPFSYRVQRGRGGVIVDVFTQQQIGLGGYKRIKNLVECFIPQDETSKIAYQKDALYRARENRVAGTLNGMKVHRRILKIPGAERCFLPAPTIHTKYEAGTGWKLESKALACDGDLLNFLENGQISSLECVDAAENIVEGLSLIHPQGFYLSDVKEDNVLFKKTKNGKRFYISDLDLAGNEMQAKPYPYYFWPKLRQEQGVCSKEIDLYSLTMLTAGVFLPEYFSSLSQAGTNYREDVYFKALFNPEEVKKESLTDEIRRIKETLPRESRSLFDPLLKFSSSASLSKGFTVDQRASASASFDDLFEGREGEIKKALESLLSYAKQVEQEDSKMSRKIQRFVVNFLVFDDMFALFREGLSADRVSTFFVDPLHISMTAPLSRIQRALKQGKVYRIEDKAISLMEEVGKVLGKREIQAGFERQLVEQLDAFFRRLTRFAIHTPKTSEQQLSSIRDSIEQGKVFILETFPGLNPILDQIIEEAYSYAYGENEKSTQLIAQIKSTLEYNGIAEDSQKTYLEPANQFLEYISSYNQFKAKASLDDLEKVKLSIKTARSLMEEALGDEFQEVKTLIREIESEKLTVVRVAMPTLMDLFEQDLEESLGTSSLAREDQEEIRKILSSIKEDLDQIERDLAGQSGEEARKELLEKCEKLSSFFDEDALFITEREKKPYDLLIDVITEKLGFSPLEPLHKQLQVRKAAYMEENMGYLEATIEKAATQAGSEVERRDTLLEEAKSLRINISKALDMDVPSKEREEAQKEVERISNLLSALFKTSAGKTSLEKAGFPSLDRFREVFSKCRKVAEAVEEKYKEI